MTRVRVRLIAVLVLAFATSACSGPHVPLEVGVKEIDTDVLIGPQRALPIIVPRTGTQPGPVGFPGFVQPPIDVNVPPSPEPPPACPVADPLSPIAHEVSSTVVKPPVPRSYPFRNNGTWKVGNRSGVFPAIATRRVENIVNPAPGGGFSFDVTIPDRAGSTTTTTYHVYPISAVPNAPDPGLYIEEVVTRTPGRTDQTFTPVPSLLLLPFPAAPSRTWSSRGVDPLHQTVEQFDATILQKAFIDACGTRLEAWKVFVSGGSIASPTTSISFSATLWIAPQYGGLLLQDKVDQSGAQQEEGTRDFVEVLSSNTATIRTAPGYPS